MNHYFTPTPNILFDKHLPHLSESEVKVLLAIIRQTYGWQMPHSKERRKRAWISSSLFRKMTGLSERSISLAVSNLVSNKQIIVTNQSGWRLNTPASRMGQDKLFFELHG